MPMGKLLPPPHQGGRPSFSCPPQQSCKRGPWLGPGLPGAARCARRCPRSRFGHPRQRICRLRVPPGGRGIGAAAPNGVGFAGPPGGACLSSLCPSFRCLGPGSCPSHRRACCPARGADPVCHPRQQSPGRAGLDSGPAAFFDPESPPLLGGALLAGGFVGVATRVPAGPAPSHASSATAFGPGHSGAVRRRGRGCGYGGGCGCDYLGGGAAATVGGGPAIRGCDWPVGGEPGYGCARGGASSVGGGEGCDPARHRGPTSAGPGQARLWSALCEGCFPSRGPGAPVADQGVCLGGVVSALPGGSVLHRGPGAPRFVALG